MVEVDKACKGINIKMDLEIEGKNHVIISVETEKSFNKIQHPFMIQYTQQTTR